ncbi:MAG: NAD(P)H-dependent oxidoreductase [Ruminococcus sp.]|nr:NAD(P)H-dependent oxidoreductase [Ruminococcus sp.]
MILFINACVRKYSRTKCLADVLLQKLGDDVKEIKLSEIDFPNVDEKFLQTRDSLIAEKQFDNPMFEQARLFASADKIVIAAPYWDLSFPAVLKQYIEQINVLGITFVYTPEGVPKGLCKGSELYYITTAGGDYMPEGYGFGYVKALAENFYGINDVKIIKATGLDIYGANIEKIISDTIDKI